MNLLKLKPTLKIILFFISMNFIVFSYVDICAPLLAKIVSYNQTQIHSFQCNQCQVYKKMCVGYKERMIGPRVYTYSLQKLQFLTMIKANQILNQTSLYIVIRGTVPSQLQNWITNFKYQKVPYLDHGCQKCHVHQGFYLAFLRMRMEMHKIIKNFANTWNGAFNLSIIGHSLGGAIATFVAIQAKSIEPNLIVSLITYGQPRVGDSKFASFVNQVVSRTERNIHYADIVPHLPSMSQGFAHYNMQYWYQQNMKSYRICIAQNPSCANSISDWDVSIGDHSMDQYILIFRNYDIGFNCSMTNSTFQFKRHTPVSYPIQINYHYSGIGIYHQVQIYSVIDINSDPLRRCRGSKLYNYTIEQLNSKLTYECVLGISDEGTFTRKFTSFIYIDGEIEYECDGFITQQITA